MPYAHTSSQSQRAFDGGQKTEQSPRITEYPDLDGPSIIEFNSCTGHPNNPQTLV